MINRFIFTLSLALWVFLCPAQQPSGDLYRYIPRSDRDLLEVRVKIHVIQYSFSDPRNYTVADTAAIHRQMAYINSFYSHLYPPTLRPEKEVEFIPDSRIRFKVEGIYFYADSLLWDRIFFKEASDKYFPAHFHQVDLSRSEIRLEGNLTSPFRRKDTRVVIKGSEGNDGHYTVDTAFFVQAENRTVLRFREPLSSAIPGGEITYFREEDLNCRDDIYKNLIGKDENYLHIIHTGSSAKESGFGCGPSPYFLNISNVYKRHEWSSAQLVAHELGHCLGLRHTDYPQFDDLPKKDKFGFIECDSIEVSNNIMGYNKCRRYLSPLQIAHIHKAYSTNPRYIRTRAECVYDERRSLKVTRNETWQRARVIGGDLIVKRNKTLTLDGMVSMPENGRIILEKNAKLVINGATVTQHCNATWKGVYTCKRYRGVRTILTEPVTTQVQLKEGARMENVVP